MNVSSVKCEKVFQFFIFHLKIGGILKIYKIIESKNFEKEKEKELELIINYKLK